MSAGVSMNSRYPEALEATARGGDLRRTTEIAGESERGETQELAGRPHCDSKYWFGVVEQVTLETFFGLAGWRRKLLPHRGSFFNTWRSLDRSRLKQGFFCNESLTFTQRAGPLRFGFTFFSGTCLSTCCFGDLVLVLRNVKHGGRSPGRNEVRCSSVHCHVFATFGAVNQALVRELERPCGEASWQAAWEPRSSWRIVQIVGDLHVVPVQRKYWTRGWASAVQAPTGTFRIA